MHTTTTTITLTIPKGNNQSPRTRITSSPAAKRINQQSELIAQTSTNTNDQNVNKCINENLNSVQDIIEHFQQFSKRNSSNQTNTFSNESNTSSPNVNMIIQNLNNSSATSKTQQTNFASISHRPVTTVNFFM